MTDHFVDTNKKVSPRALMWLRELVEFGSGVLMFINDDGARYAKKMSGGRIVGFFPNDVAEMFERELLIDADDTGIWYVTPAGRKAVKHD